MAIPIVRVHLSMAHAALPALLPTPPKWKMLPLLPTTPCVAAILGLPKPLAKPSRADSDKRWDARKTKPASVESSASSSPRSADSVRSSAAGSGSSRNNATSPPKPCRADSVERWDTDKKAASPASSSSSSSSGTSPLVSSTCTISRASSAERWDVHKKRRPSQDKALDDDGESSSTGSNDDIDTEEILWKPRDMYAGAGFTIAATDSSMLPMLVPVA